MAFIKCNMGGGKNPILPNVLYYRDDINNNILDADNVNFDCSKPIYTFKQYEAFIVPVGSDFSDSVLFKVDYDAVSVYALGGSSTIHGGTYYDYSLIDPVIIQSINNIDADLKLPNMSMGINVANPTLLDTYGFHIIGIWYINPNEFLMMYNWHTSDTALSATYSRVFKLVKYNDGYNDIYISNADTTFGVSLSSSGIGSVVGSYYRGRIFKSDFNDNGAKLGIAYLRSHILATGVMSQEVLWHGYLASYITTTASYISIAKALASTLLVNTSQTNVKRKYAFGNSDGFFTYSIASNSAITNRFYYQRNSATNVGGTAAFLYNDGNNIPTEIINSLEASIKESEYNVYAPCILGKLINNIYVIYLYDNIAKKYKISFYEILYASANNTALFNKINDIEICDKDNYHKLELLDNNILVDITDQKIYQIIFNNSYELEKLGNCKCNIAPIQTQFGTTPKLSYNCLGLYSDKLNGVILQTNHIKNVFYDFESLSQPRYKFDATTVGDYALFAGGETLNYNKSNVVDAYDTSLIRYNPSALSAARAYLAATTIGNYALFGGGGSSGFDIVDAYDINLNKCEVPVLNNRACDLAATTVGDYALFGGGYYSSYPTGTVTAYNKVLTKIQNVTSLGESRRGLGATTVGDYALFVGGTPSTDEQGTPTSTVDVYDCYLTKLMNLINLNTPRRMFGSATVGDYALFGGGFKSGSLQTVEGYDKTLTKINDLYLSSAREGISAGTIKNHLLFDRSYSVETTADWFDTQLTQITAPSSACRRCSYTAITAVGNYLLSAGGYSNGQPFALSGIEAYKID